jgi:ABC-type nitrate/sulfonate/bicarbonate transport system substrate-binding protein
LRKAYAVDSSTLKWAASPQETLIGVLRRGDADAVVLLDQFFHQGEQADDIACLYTDGDAWKRLTAFDEMIKHIVAASESLIRQNPSLRDALLAAFRESFAYSERNMDEVADVFVKTYGGEREALLVSARYPRVEFTFTDSERRLAQRQMEMFVEVGRLLRNAPIENFFAM